MPSGRVLHSAHHHTAEQPRSHQYVHGQDGEGRPFPLLHLAEAAATARAGAAAMP